MYIIPAEKLRFSSSGEVKKLYRVPRASTKSAHMFLGDTVSMSP